MIIEGYRGNVNFSEVAKIIAKHTGITLKQSAKICDQIKEGRSVTLEDDFVLREDLEELNIFIR